MALWIAGIALTLLRRCTLIIVGLAHQRRLRADLPGGVDRLCDDTAKAGRSSAVGLYVTCFYAGGSFGAAVGGLAWTIGAGRPASRWSWPCC